MRAESPIQKAAEIRQQTCNLIEDFLKVEVQVSSTFVEAALNSGSDSRKRIRNQAAARKGYDTICKYLGKYSLSPSPDFKEALDRLKTALKDLGEAELCDYPTSS
ncbi:MAG: hypothetical protein ACM3JB_22635 [Acidobacteriaceae bacterium]